MDWDDLRYVQAVARTGSVRGAGEALRVHGSTVARHLDHLERQLGIQLFERTPRGMHITASGSQVMDALDRVAAELGQVERSLKSRGSEQTGRVSLAAPAALAGNLVIPTLSDFRRRHPDIDLSLPEGQPLEMLQRGEADLALWETDDPPGDLVGRPLALVMACAYAAPVCLRGENRGAAAGGVRWVGSSDPASISARARSDEFADLPPGLCVDDVMSRAGALEAGLGIGLLPCYLGDASPRLVRAGAMGPARQGQLWLFTRPDTRGVARIQAVAAFLQELFAAQRHRLEGFDNPEPE